MRIGWRSRRRRPMATPTRDAKRTQFPLMGAPAVLAAWGARLGAARIRAAQCLEGQTADTVTFADTASTRQLRRRDLPLRAIALVAEGCGALFVGEPGRGKTPLARARVRAAPAGPPGAARRAGPPAAPPPRCPGPPGRGGPPGPGQRGEPSRRAVATAPGGPARGSAAPHAGRSPADRAAGAAPRHRYDALLLATDAVPSAEETDHGNPDA
jgi:hypothetical protein